MCNKITSLWHPLCSLVPFSACPCTLAIERPSYEGYRLILVPTSLEFTCPDQSERHIQPSPIRTTERSPPLSGQSRIQLAQWRGTPKKSTPLRNIVNNAVFFQYIFPPHKSVFGHGASLSFGGSRHGWKVVLWTNRFAIKTYMIGDFNQ